MRSREVAGGGDLKDHSFHHTRIGTVEEHRRGRTMMVMSIIANHPGLKDREEAAVFLPQRMTEQEFVDWCDDETWAEWIDGRVLVMSPVNFEHAKLTAFLIKLVGGFADEHDLGEVVSEPFQIRFARLRRRRSPDLIFIARNRLPKSEDTQFEGAPDLIMEVVSWDSQNRDRRDKFIEYEAAGVREYWLVDPLSKTVDAFTLKGKTFVQFGAKAEIVRSKVLRRFYIKPSWLWRSRLPSVSSLLKEMAGKR